MSTISSEKCSNCNETLVSSNTLKMRCGGQICDCIKNLKVEYFKCFNCNEQHKTVDVLNLQIKRISENLKDKKKEINERAQTLKQQTDNEKASLINSIDTLHSHYDKKIQPLFNELREGCNSNNENVTSKLEILQDEIDKYKNYSSKIVFKSNTNFKINKRMIGTLNIPSMLNCENVNNVKTIFETKMHGFLSVTVLIDKKSIVTAHSEEKRLRIFDFDGNEIIKSNTVNQEILQKPVGMCSNTDNEIFVGDYNTNSKKIFVFDCELNLVRSFGESDLIEKPFTMIIDEETDLLYISEWRNNEVTIYNSKCGKYEKKFEIESPIHIDIRNGKLYVVSYTVWHYGPGNYIDQISKGANGIFVCDKYTNQILNVIKFDDWFHPLGVYIDCDDNIITTAWSLNNKIRSDERYLFVINSNGEIIKKVKLNDQTPLLYLHVVNNKFVFSYHNSIKITQD